MTSSRQRGGFPPIHSWAQVCFQDGRSVLTEVGNFSGAGLWMMHDRGKLGWGNRRTERSFCPGPTGQLLSFTERFVKPERWGGGGI